MAAGGGKAAEEKGKIGGMGEEKEEATANKEKGAMAEEKEEKGAAAEKEGASAEGGESDEAEEKESMFTSFCRTEFFEKGAAAAGKEKGATAEKEEKEAKGEDKGEKTTFFFTSGKIITLMSSDGVLFKVSEEAARLSVLLAGMIDEGCAGSTIPLRNVDAWSLDMVIDYCEKHAAAKHAANHGTDEGSSRGNTEASRVALNELDRDFVDGLRMDELYDIMKAANFLHVKELLGAACQKVADMIKSMTPEQVRELFGIANDYTEEEEEEIRKENAWAYEE